MKKSIAGLLSAIVLLAAAAPPAQAQFTDTNIAYAKRDLDLNYFPDDTTTLYRVKGRVISPNYSTNSTEIYIQDTNDNVGIYVQTVATMVNTGVHRIGTEMRVGGLIKQTNGVRYINPTSGGLITQTDTNAIPVAPLPFTIASLLASPESYEGTLVVVSNVNISSGTWPDWKSSANLTITDLTGQVTLRLDSDTQLDGQLGPTNTFDIIGVFSQFTTAATPSNGYQIVARYYEDVVQYTGPETPSLQIQSSNSLYSIGAGQTLTIDVIGRDRNGTDTLTITTPVAPGSSGISNIESRTARFTWTPAGGDVGTTSTVEFVVSDGTTATTGTVSVFVLNAIQANIVLNEIQWDPSNVGLAGDANNDGTNNATHDEFIEIVNNNTSLVDITGWILRAGTNVLFTFPATVLTGETAVVVFGGGSPAGLFGNAIVYAPTSTWFGLANTGSQGPVNLLDTNGIQIFSYDYAPFEDNINQSITRDPDITGDFDLHTNANPAKLFSPGTFASGAAFPGSGLTNTAPSITAIADTYVRPGNAVTVTVTATDAESDGITLSVSNAPPTAAFVDNGNGTGALSYTGEVADAGSNFTITVYATDGAAFSTEPFVLSVVATQYLGLVINEFLPDPDSPTLYIDANNDGVTNATQDEFVEIVNAGATPVDLTGMIVGDLAGITHRFAAYSLPTGGHIVVFGGGSVGSFTNPPGVLSTVGSLSLNNGGDSIFLYTPQTTIITRVDYGTAPQAASFTRYPDFTGEFTNHYEATGFNTLATPGRRVSGAPFLTNQAVVLLAIGSKSVDTGSNITFSVSAAESDGDAVTLSVSNAPAGSTFSSTNRNGTFIWTNASPVGVYTTTFYAVDKDGVDSETITITVAAGPDTGAVVIVAYEFDYGTNVFTNVATFVTNQIDASVMSVLLSTPNNVQGNPTTGRSMSVNTWTNGSGQYFTFTITPSSGYQVVLSSLSFHHLRSSTGPTNWSIRSSVDGFAADLGTGLTSANWLTNTISLSMPAQTNSLSFRFYATNTLQGTGTWRLDNVRLFGTVQAVSSGNDADGDLLPNEWEAEHFGGNTNASAEVDTDGDGFINLYEFIALTDPTNANSFFEVAAFTNSGGRKVTFQTATGRVYRVDYSTNLLDAGGWNILTSGIPGSGSSTIATDTNLEPTRTYRIEVNLP